MNVDKLIEQAQGAVKKRNYDYAISIFLEAVNFAPNNREAREGLRAAELRKYEAGYPSKLAIFFGTLGNKFGILLARLGRKGNPEGYMMACEKYLVKDPKSLKVSMALGDAAAMAGHLESAIVAYNNAAEHHPEDITALKHLGALLWKRGDIREAHDVFDRVVRIDGRDQEALKSRKNLAAEISLKETGFERATSSRDLVKDKGAAGRLERDTRMHRSEADLSSEEEGLLKKLEEEPENVDVLLDLAEVYEKQKAWDKAVDALDRAIEKKPSDEALAFQKGDIQIHRFEAELLQLQQGDNGEAQASKQKELLAFQMGEFARRVKAYPTDLNLRFKLAELLLADGATDDAIAQFQQTVRDPRFAADSQLRLGEAFARKNEYELALRQFEKALASQIGMTERRKEILYAMGDAQQSSGDREAARSAFSKIYEVDINYEDVADRLAALSKSSGS